MIESKYNLPSFGSLDHTLFFPQNLPSVIVGHLMDVGQGDLVLDMCAAPGTIIYLFFSNFQNSCIETMLNNTKQLVP